jgi:hypothetical protein
LDDQALDSHEGGDPRDAIVRLEERIEELAAKIENCRKLILISRIAVAGGTLVLAGMLFGLIGFDPAVMAAAVAALLGGFVVWGSNRSTAQEAAKDLALAHANLSALIERLDLDDVTPPRGPSIEMRDGGGA